MIKNEKYFFNVETGKKKEQKRIPMDKIVVHFPAGLMDWMEDLVKNGRFVNKAQIVRYCLRLYQDKFLE